MKSRKGQPGRGSSNLMALGSAAVLAVYTAGYLRTKPAADLLAAQSSMRRPPRGTAGAQGAPARPVEASAGNAAASAAASAVPGDSAAIAASIAAALAGSAPSSVPTMEAAPGSASGLDAPTNPSTASSEPAVVRDSTVAVPASLPATPPPVAVAVGSAPQALAVASPITVQQPSNPAPVVAPPVAAPVQPAPAPPPQSKPQAPAPSAPAPAAPAQKAAAAPAAAAGRTTYKDGMFFGRGTSRHGDIESMVEISNGRIIGAVIARCLTQYSCSWIAALPPQVVVRQSPDVDYVTGATESANAFYFSIVQALSQAK